jgi:hypothetical protein
MTDPHDIGREAGEAVVKAAPGFVLWLINPPNLLLLLSIVYVVLQIGFLLFRWRREWMKRGEG